MAFLWLVATGAAPALRRRARAVLAGLCCLIAAVGASAATEACSPGAEQPPAGQLLELEHDGRAQPRPCAAQLGMLATSGRLDAVGRVEALLLQGWLLAGLSDLAGTEAVARQLDQAAQTGATPLASAAALLVRARLAEQASQAKILENTERLQAALLSSISHELRTPLVSITGALSTLAEAPEPLETGAAETTAWREMVDTAYEEAQRLNMLVGNLLDMTRLEAGAFRLNREPCDIQDLVGIALARFSQRLDTHPIQVSLPEELPLVSIDVALMTQVLLNLLDNAVKYSPEQAPIEILGWLEADEVILAVIDQGIGFPEADLPHVFDRFFRTSRTHGIGGLGLGLSISKGIVEAHGGRMWAENRPTRGALIGLALPVENSSPGEGV